jgi:anti-sigma-K factor RskA
MNTSDTHALTGVYVTDALDFDERRASDEHLRACPECRTEIEGFRATTAVLAEVSAAEPPATLRRAVLDSVDRGRQTPPIHDAKRSRSSRQLPTKFWQGLAAACVVIALAATLFGYSQHLHGDSVADPGVAAVLREPDVMATSGDLSTGQATVLYSARGQVGVLLGRSIPSAAAGKTYQLWVMHADPTPSTSMGLFHPDALGTVLVTFSGDLVPGDRLGVSVEPASGSSAPSNVLAVLPVRS